MPVFRFDSSNFEWNQWYDQVTITKQLDSKQLIKEDTVTSTQPSVRDPRAVTSNKPPVELYLGQGLFTSVENDSSIVITQEYKFKSIIELGSIKGSITTDKPSFIIQLLDDKLKVLREIRNQKRYNFENLEPGKYQIRVLVDLNQNGKWDNGNIYELSTPEPVVFVEGDLIIRSNWELEGQNVTF